MRATTIAALLFLYGIGAYGLIDGYSKREKTIQNTLNNPVQTVEHIVGTVKGISPPCDTPYERPETYSDIVVKYEPKEVIDRVGISRLSETIAKLNDKDGKNIYIIYKGQTVRVPIYQFKKENSEQPQMKSYSNQMKKVIKPLYAKMRGKK